VKVAGKRPSSNRWPRKRFEVEGSATASGTPFRAATKGDGRKIAELFRVSSDGVADYVWSTLASEYSGLTPIEIGTRRYAGEEGRFSYKNCIMAERGER